MKDTLLIQQASLLRYNIGRQNKAPALLVTAQGMTPKGLVPMSLQSTPRLVRTANNSQWRICIHCGNDFQALNTAINIGRAKCCSKRCANQIRNAPVAAIDRFWSFVQKGDPDECWTWTGMTVKGYGRIRIGDHLELAHRLSFAHHTGVNPGELKVLHKCDNPPCVNPAHLFLGTIADNVLDMMQKERSNAKLSAVDVRSIREMAGVIPQSEIAEKFEVSRAAICCLLKGKTWRHVK